MQKVTLANSDICVSALCLGTDQVGSKIDRETSFRLLDLFREQGGTFIDTGNFYAAWLPGCQGGESESTIGQWMKDRAARNEMVISTKLGFDYPGCSGGLSAVEIERECEKSLRRLQTERLDLFYAHRDDPQTPLEETMAAFDCLIRAGKVRAIGASNLRVWRIAEANTVSRDHAWAQLLRGRAKTHLPAPATRRRFRSSDLYQRRPEGLLPRLRVGADRYTRFCCREPTRGRTDRCRPSTPARKPTNAWRLCGKWLRSLARIRIR